MKEYVYKVYDTAGNFIETIDDVASPPVISTEINSAGSELKLSLARAPDNYGEGGSIEFNNTIKVLVKKDDDAEPVLFFQGKIVSYTPKYEANEGVEIVLYSLGAELDSHIYKANESPEQDSSSGTSEDGIGTGMTFEQSFIPDQPTLTSVDLKLYIDSTQDIRVGIHADSGGTPNGSSIADGTVTKEITNTSAEVINFTFTNPPTLTVGNTYWIVAQVV